MDEEAQKKLTQETLEAVRKQKEAYAAAYEARLLKTIKNQKKYLSLLDIPQSSKIRHANPQVNEVSESAFTPSGSLGTAVFMNLRNEIQDLQDIESERLRILVNAIGSHLDSNEEQIFADGSSKANAFRQKVMEAILTQTREEVLAKIPEEDKEFLKPSLPIYKKFNSQDGRQGNTAHEVHEAIDPNMALIDTTSVGIPTRIKQKSKIRGAG